MVLLAAFMTQVGALQTAPILIAVVTAFLAMEGVKYRRPRQPERAQPQHQATPGPSSRERRPLLGLDEPRAPFRLQVGAAAARANSTVMADEIEARAAARPMDCARVTTPRGAAIVIASVTTSITVVAGLVMTVFDHDDFPSIGTGLWFAVQTVTTVGYGDYVPPTVAARLLATLVMLLGIGFLTVVTTSITRGRSWNAHAAERKPAKDRLSPTGEQPSSARSMSGWNGSRPRLTAPVIPFAARAHGRRRPAMSAPSRPGLACRAARSGCLG